jgi:hypothetical protein
MYTIDDPMFALILRFVGYNQEITFHDHGFIQKELKTIREHIKKYPSEEQGSRAIEWIEKYAREYRKRWEEEIIDKELSSQICSDCPLSVINDSEHCQIHEQWMTLLQQYAADEIDSKKYIENTLKLITQHKEDLKVKLSMLQERGIELTE